MWRELFVLALAAAAALAVPQGKCGIVKEAQDQRMLGTRMVILSFYSATNSGMKYLCYDFDCSDRSKWQRVYSGEGRPNCGRLRICEAVRILIKLHVFCLIFKIFVLYY